MPNRGKKRRIEVLYWSTQQNCEEALQRLCDDYNRLADQWEDMYAALEQIAAGDYRGNEPSEQRIAREVLSGL